MQNKSKNTKPKTAKTLLSKNDWAIVKAHTKQELAIQNLDREIKAFIDRYQGSYAKSAISNCIARIITDCSRISAPLVAEDVKFLQALEQFIENIRKKIALFDN